MISQNPTSLARVLSYHVNFRPNLSPSTYSNWFGKEILLFELCPACACQLKQQASAPGWKPQGCRKIQVQLSTNPYPWYSIKNLLPWSPAKLQSRFHSVVFGIPGIFASSNTLCQSDSRAVGGTLKLWVSRSSTDSVLESKTSASKSKGLLQSVVLFVQYLGQMSKELLIVNYHIEQGPQKHVDVNDHCLCS